MRVAGAFAALTVFAVLSASGGARAQEPIAYTLDLDTGGHRAQVKDLAFSPDGTLLVSASDDKTIRVWDWRNGETLRVIRGFVSPGNDGKVFAIDVSPDGGTIAAGGYFGEGIGDKPPYGDIRLFDLKSGRMTGVLKGNEDVVFDLDFSPDGTLLAASGQNGYVYLWKRDTSAAGGWTAWKRLDGDSERIERIAFVSGGKGLAATTADYGIRLWSVESGDQIVLEEAETLENVPVPALAVTASGDRFAIGTADGRVEIRSAETGALVETMAQQDFRIGTLAFTDRDQRLVAGCGYGCAERNGAVVWTLGKAEPERQYREHDGAIHASVSSPDGTVVATAGGTRNEILIWDPASGRREQRLAGRGAPVFAAGIAADGTAIAWGNANPCPELVECSDRPGALQFTMALPTETRSFTPPRTLAEQDAAFFRRAILQDGGWALRAAAGGDHGLENAMLEIVRDGSVVQSILNDATTGFLHASYTLLADGKGVVSGGNDGTIVERDRETGRVTGEFAGGHTGEVHAMAEAVRGKLFLTASADQTMALWNKETHRLVANLFLAGDQWVVWVPQGYYWSSPKGDDLFGWRVNQGRDEEARFIKARQLRDYLHNPDLVRRAILLADAEQAVKELRPTDLGLSDLLKNKPPEFEVRVAEDVADVPDGFVALEIVGSEDAGAAVADIAILANERRVDRFAARDISTGGRRIVTVPVGEGDNAILVSGVNELGYITERSVKAIGKRKGEKKEPGKLYVLAIGVEDYPNLPTQCNGRSCNLRFPVDDAAEFLRTVAEKTRPLYSEMEALVLVNRDKLEDDAARSGALRTLLGEAEIEEPEADTITDKVEEFLARPGRDDTTVIFVAGHGINIDDRYYFIPSDGEMRDAERWQRSSLVNWSVVQDAVEDALGQRFMFLDTCHAGNAFNPRLQKDAEDARIVVVSATTGDSTAAELPELGHGVFTYSLLEGMRGAAKMADEGVTFFDLMAYTDREVKRITAEKQVPVLYASGLSNFLWAKP